MGIEDYNLINNDLINLSSENILSDIMLVISNIPNNVSNLEKIRWVYIKLGRLFCYDYRVANNPEVGYDKVINYSEFIGRYQTCIQISDILNRILNSIDGVRSEIVPRVLKNARGHYGHDHVGNLVTINENGETLRLLLDLTLDLYLIQSESMTMHFGYDDDGSGTLDIISQNEDRLMDAKLGLVATNNRYTDDDLKELEYIINGVDYSKFTNEEVIDYKIKMINSMFRRFSGYHEGKQYTNMLMNRLLKMDYKEFNMYLKNDDKINLKTVYNICYKDTEKWIIYSNKIGVVETDKSILRDMLNNGWTTNSETLLDILYATNRNKR